MIPNPALGVFFHWLGGLASASFYVPYRGVKRWSWETYWLVGGFFSWIIAPWLLAIFLTRDLSAVLAETPLHTIFWVVFFGLLWGIGGLTFGLTMRYLGLSLGMAVVLGLCAAFGTLMPPIFSGVFVSQVLGTISGRVILVGVFVCLMGISAAGVAGACKERTMSPEQKKTAIKEFDLKKGLAVATLSGVMSACFAYGLAAGGPIKSLTLRHGTPVLWQGLPVLVVVLIGGFTTNFVWCVALNIKNKTGFEYFTAKPGRYKTIADEPILETAIDAPSREVVTHIRSHTAADSHPVPVIVNYLLCALAGTTWYFQFFFYTMGETQMGKYGFSSWTLHMASIIIFSTLWGIGFREWRGAGATAMRFLGLSLLLLVGSTLIVGYGNFLAAAGAH
ncbi:MAG: L-rhamnose/proton symporter RhaT [Candidatus Acidiferrum sp.]